MRLARYAMIFALLVGGCSAPDPAPKPTPEQATGRAFLVFWLPGADYSPVQSKIEGHRPAEEGGEHRLAEAIVECGQPSVTVELRMAYVKSTVGDRRLVTCVQEHVGFGFDATRTTELNMVPPDGVEIRPE